MNLYFKNISGDGLWSDPDNWFTDAAATTAYNAIPWAANDVTKDYDLYRSTDSIANGEIVYIDAVTIGGSGFVITGECLIGYDSGSTNSGSLEISTGIIFGGTFSGDAMINSSTIYGGTFIDGLNNQSTGIIFGGTFSGTNNNYGTVYGGTFSGGGINGQYIYGGIFSGANYSNDNLIYGGTFSGSGFYNSDTINGGIFCGASFIDSNSGANINGGFWLESGSADVAIFDFASGSTLPTISGYTRITGNVSNPYPLELALVGGFMSLRILGQDVLGTGLL